MPFTLVIALVAQSPFALQPCHLASVDAPPPARCGTYWVYEDRARRAGRRIPLKVIILPARDPVSAPDPMLLVSPGGPGSTNSELGVTVALGAAWRDNRDVVLVDLRGTSGPNRLDCRMPGSDDHPEGYLSTLFPTAAIRACRDELSKVADLRLYNTMLAVDDVDEVRAALGYKIVNLWGASWGTRAVLIYLRRHPQSVRSAIIEGVAPVSFKNPLPHARSAQDAIDSLFKECDRQTACHAAFPDVRHELAAVFERLKRSPAEVTIADSAAGTRFTARLSWQQFAEALRVMTYNLGTARRVPMLVHRAYLGDLAPFARAGIASNRGLRRILRLGFLLSVTCTEDVSRIAPDEIERETAGTYLGDSRVREQIAACAGWPHGSLPADYGDPVRSDVPVFLLSGTVDPVSPQQFAADAARYLSHSIHVLAPGAHVPTGPCIDSMERAFLDAASPTAVDTSCVRTMALPTFVTSDSAAGD
ncbi:MAG TPA: alpha/beta fold hydrolase [Gemmatimonadales bacterium]|nr:alpha/beta fold hydrolase [Gemmatimonadales bacterium]